MLLSQKTKKLGAHTVAASNDLKAPTIERKISTYNLKYLLDLIGSQFPQLPLDINRIIPNISITHNTSPFYWFSHLVQSQLASPFGQFVVSSEETEYESWINCNHIPM